MAGSPRYRWTAGSPPAPTRGIAIAVPAVVALDRGASIPLHGSFRVDKADLARFEGNPLRAVVVVVREPVPRALSLGRGELLFSDDVHDEGEVVSGYFNLELFDAFGLRPAPHKYWVSASIQQHVSASVGVEVVARGAP